MQNQESTAYTFARIVNAKYKLGSDRRALTLFWLSYMSKDVIERWGKGELLDADIIHKANEMKLPSTTPWLEDHGSGI
jgi:hypothetical protein